MNAPIKTPVKKTPLGYDEAMQKAAVAAFADSTGSDFWSEVQKHLDKPSDLVSKRPSHESE